MSSFVDVAYARARALLPTRLRGTLLLRAFGMFKVPMIAYVRPVVDALDAERCVVRIPLRRRTKNHVGSMYFGVFAVGADVAGGLIAMEAITERGADVVILFKDSKSDFLLRAEGDVCFTCEDGARIRAAVDRAVATGERQNVPLTIVATVPDKLGDRPVARCELTLTMKARGPLTGAPR